MRAASIKAACSNARGARAGRHSLDLEEIVRSLLAELPEAIGAIVCDGEGEAVVSVLGASPPPPGAEEQARSRIPSKLAPAMSLSEFLLRVGGAEPCGLIAQLEECGTTRRVGALDGFDLRFSELDVLVRRLPEQYYVMLALRRPSARALAGARLETARARLAALI